MNRCQVNSYVECIPSKDECGVRVVVEANRAVAKVCNEVNYQVTITNNSDVPLKDAYLTIPVDNALALMPKSVYVNGCEEKVDDLNNVPLGNIDPGATVVLSYVVTVMTCQRYIKTQAKVYFNACCCFEVKRLCVLSNVNCLQVCYCCCSN